MALEDDVKKVLVSEEDINRRCVELGKQLSEEYNGKKPVFVGLLKGSVPFLAELIKRVTIDIEVDFMDVSSYEGTESVGDVRIVKDLDRSVKDDYVIIVEDIVDTGKTLKKVKELLYQKGAIDVRIVTLLNKPQGRKVQIEPEYIGFNIPDEFVIGYGLDYNQKFRNLPYVGVLKEECYK